MMRRDPSPFVFSVSDLLADRATHRSESIVADVDWRVELTVVGPGLKADVHLQGVSGGVLVRGSARSIATHSCHRCLTAVKEDLEVSLSEVIGLESDPDGYRLDGDDADLEPLVRDALLLTAPLAPLCREDCLGLCSECGADLNTGACPGHEEETNSPFAGLREFLEP